MTKKIFGYLLITIALLLAVLVFFASFQVIGSIIKVFRGGFNMHDILYAMGMLVGIGIIFVLPMMLLLRLGQKWIKKS